MTGGRADSEPTFLPARCSQAAPDAKASRKILELAREQQDEMDLLLDDESGQPRMDEEEEEACVDLLPLLLALPGLRRSRD